ncbi:hypothetical protein QBC45DRAFT_62929 [Copromyces sp. CBS 386.78]|nr:hypothetical protein QBC45DRAFT_62929 [Copromyces sp. CBS 386.78]
MVVTLFHLHVEDHFHYNQDHQQTGQSSEPFPNALDALEWDPLIPSFLFFCFDHGEFRLLIVMGSLRQSSSTNQQNDRMSSAPDAGDDSDLAPLPQVLPTLPLDLIPQTFSLYYLICSIRSCRGTGYLFERSAWVRIPDQVQVSRDMNPSPISRSFGRSHARRARQGAHGHGSRPQGIKCHSFFSHHLSPFKEPAAEAVS